MPQTLLGTGGTSMERMAAAVLDKIAPGTSSLTTGFFNTPSASSNFSQFVQENIFHKSGAQLIMCGETTVGEDIHVCGK